MSSKYLLPKYQHLQKEYDSVVQCNRCGFCETICPTYVVSGKETLSPRGRNQALRQILEGKNRNPALASEIFSTCLTCHACTNVCFSEVPVAKLMAHARSLAQEDDTAGKPVKYLARFLFLHRRILSVLVWPAFLLKKIGVSAFLKKTGILSAVSPELSAAEELVEKVPLKFGAEKKTDSANLDVPGRNSTNAFSSPPNSKTAYFSGCGIHYLYPDAAQSVAEILEGSGTKLNCPNHSCCGLTLNSMGDIEGSKQCARKIVNQFKKMETDAVVIDDDSCCGFIKSYGDFLPGNPDAAGISKKAMNLAEFLSSLSKSAGPFESSPKEICRVTYHDSCQMGNAHHQINAPRTILKQLPGITFLEMNESDWCCGGAGTYCLKHPHLAEDVLERKLQNIKESGADTVISQASSCLLHIEYGLRKKGWQKKIRVMHLAELLSQYISA